ncbi:integrase catalytic domain-containing protein [Trichonephila clavipes]|nr:integrase catalytic domain-containing protein [Trichonephila clavipes]
MYGIQLTDLENSSLKAEKEIKLLIGADVEGKLFTGKIIPLKSNLTAVHTCLGWTVMGKLFGSEPSVEKGRYEVALPCVADNFSLSENRKLAEKGLMNTKRKLMASGKLEAYGEVFDNWLNLGSPSLNDCLSTEPNLIEIIPTILNRYRRNYIGVTSNIEKAFLQISIKEKDRDYLRFLWLEKDDLERVQEYRHRRVVFGLTCSPYLLAATLQYHLTKVEENLSCTSEILKTAFYVDNCVTSLDSELEMRKFILESQIIMSSGNFNLRGWKSNLHSVEPIQYTSTDTSVSVLGLVWYTDSDMLSCKIEITNISEKPITKRLVLVSGFHLAHQVFDPIGFTVPVTLIPRLILQETWNLKLRWDNTLPNDLLRKFKSWYQQLHLISDIRIPRWFNISPNVESVSLNLFSDASQKVFASCIFLRVKDNNQIKVRLVYARCRVVPVKTVTIPRLELLACLIEARLLSTVINDLKLYDVKIYCWTDSTTALCWIQRQENWGTFVQNRVQEIRSLTSPAGTLNVADLVSRGCSGEHLLQGKWWKGPIWLLANEENWPKSEDEPDEDLVNSEKRKNILTTLTKTDENVNWYCILLKDRVRDAATFEIVGVDLAGPLYLKHGPKAYIVLYTCAVYRAIHLELITSLTTEAFFQSLRRFIFRCGRPTTIYSNNGTNFKVVERLLYVLDWDSILARVAEEKIQWKFNPPSARWWGGGRSA